MEAATWPSPFRSTCMRITCLKKYQIKREAKFGKRLLAYDASFQVSRDSNEGAGCSSQVFMICLEKLFYYN